MSSFVVNNRDVLVMLEETYTEGRYGEISYDINDVSNALATAKELIKLLDRIASSVKLG